MDEERRPMRKDISPEMYNYNKFPGPQFVAVSDRVKKRRYRVVDF